MELCKQEAREDIGLQADPARAGMRPMGPEVDPARARTLTRAMDTAALATIEEVVYVIQVH